MGLFSTTVAVGTIHCTQGKGHVVVTPAQAEMSNQHMLAACFYAKMLYNLGPQATLLMRDVRKLVDAYWHSPEDFYQMLPDLTKSRPRHAFVGTLKKKGNGALIISTNVPGGSAAPTLAPSATKLLIRKVAENTGQMEDDDAVGLFAALLDAQTRYYESNGIPAGMRLYDGVQAAGQRAINVYMQRVG
jgi:hypothetical protein